MLIITTFKSANIKVINNTAKIYRIVPSKWSLLPVRMSAPAKGARSSNEACNYPPNYVFNMRAQASGS